MTFRLLETTRTVCFASLRSCVLPAHATMCLVTQTRCLDLQPWSTTLERIPTCVPCPLTCWDTIQTQSHVPVTAHTFPMSKTCPSHQTWLPDVMDVASTWPTTPRPFQTMGSLLSPSPPPRKHFPRPMIPRAYPGLWIHLWVPG